MYTMNDIDITFNRKTKKYHLSVETSLTFNDEEKGAQRYIRRLFTRLTEWCIENNHSTDRKPDLYDIFSDLFEGRSKGYDSIEEMYTAFKVLVDGFCGAESH